MFLDLWKRSEKKELRSKKRKSREGMLTQRTHRLMFESLENRLALAALPTGFSESSVASGLNGATAMQFSPDGKLFVAEQGGTMEVWQNNSRQQANFFQNTPLTTQTVSERGLLGIAFDPGYASNRFVYVYYTTTASDSHNRVSRFTANATGDLAVAGSEDVIMELDAHSAGNHNGGAMHFGPDGYLYIATGDNANGANAQRVDNRHGKVLRIDVGGDDFPGDNGQDYRIPGGQPTTFRVRQTNGTYSDVSPTGINQSIWAVGLRNPFTFAFQPGSGRVFINDVGQGTWEEINEGGPGRNFGWPSTEGDFTQSSFPPFTRPFYTYDHGGAEPNGIAITGGAFYNPAITQFPGQYVSTYFFADYGGNKIWNIEPSTKVVTQFASSISAPVDLKVDDAGNLYYLARGSNQIFRISYTSQPPTITVQPDSQAVTVGQSATFSVAASGAAPFTYQWQRAESGSSTFVNIAGANFSSYTLSSSQSSDNADQFRVIVTDSLSRSTNSAAAVLTVATNQPPVASITINTGLRNGQWDAGNTISFSGTGIDPEQGSLPASSFTWQVDYLSTINGGDADGDGLPGITRPFVPAFSNATNSTFTPATTGPYTLTDVAHVITLTVVDDQGRTDLKRLIINPNTATLTATTNPAGLQITIDGQPFTAPRVFDSVVGFQRPLGASSGQVIGNTTWNFSSWSDGGAATHTISTPPTNTTFAATFLPASYSAKINFQDTSSPGYAGYLPDRGLIFGDRGNGSHYGWNADNTANGRNRNSATAPDERYDTLNHLQKPGGANRWEIAVPNGSYNVHVVSGDPGFIDALNNLNLEGVIVNDPDGTDNFDEFNAVVTVSDGRLTITPAAGARNAKLAFMEISSSGPDTIPPTITVRSPANGAAVTGTSVNIDITFSESIVGVDASDLVLTGVGAASAVKAAPVNLGNNVWRFPVSNLVQGNVNVSLAPDANDIEDAAGNDLGSSVWAFTVNTQQPPFAVKVNFQTGTSPGYAGYLTDAGLVYGDRGNGYSFGWNVDNTGNARDRNATNSPDERYDTFNHMQRNINTFWEISVPNGTYNVRVVSGDPGYFDSLLRINVEDVLAINGTPTTTTRWFEGTVTVTITDGRLTISNAAGSKNNKISFMEITSAG